jgi:hypothetical protein
MNLTQQPLNFSLSTPYKTFGEKTAKTVEVDFRWWLAGDSGMSSKRNYYCGVDRKGSL